MSQLLQALNAIAAKRGEGLRPELSGAYIPETGFPMLASFARLPIPQAVDACCPKATSSPDLATPKRQID